MIRKLLCLLLPLLLLLAPAARADYDQFPDRETFSMGFDRLQTAIYRGRPVTWSISMEPTSMSGIDAGDMSVLTSILSSLQLDGILQCFKDGGYLEATVSVDGCEIASIGQAAQEDRLGINLTGEWLSIARNMQTEAALMLELDDFGMSLLDFDYSSLRAGDMPFLSEIYRQGIALWGLASPYSEDSNRLSVPSGATGHAMVYEIDTMGLRDIVSRWAEGLSAEGLSLGMAGTDLSLGMDQATFDAFVERVRDFGKTTELSKPISFSTTFGEGDILRTAKGSGTVQIDGKRSKISYSYTCTPSSTKLTRKYSIDFQPTNAADTLSLTATWMTSSNGKSSGAHEVSINASGLFDGKPYRIKANVDLVNKYALNDQGQLVETVTGRISGSLKYDDRLIADVDITRNAQTLSRAALTTGVAITDRYDASITNEDGTLFDGVIELGYTVADGASEQTDVLADATPLEGMDFIAIENLRASLAEGMAQARQSLIQSLSHSTISALLGQSDTP